ncbi:MAG: NUDIX hydrolase [Candidatus Woesearchaeota archaeon]
MQESVIVAVKYENKALIVHKKENVNDYLAGEWHLPGGGKKVGESTTETGVRETHEETGLTVYITKYLATPLSKKGKLLHWVAGEITSVDGLVAGSDVDKAQRVSVNQVPLYCSKAYKTWPEEVKNYFSNPHI